MDQKRSDINQIKYIYLLVLLLSVAIIAPTHIFPQPYFMYARFPHYLEVMKPFLGISWPFTFDIYHYVLLALAIIFSINVLGIFFYPKFKKIAIISSGVGICLIVLMILFLFLVFINVNFSTAVIYGIYSMALLITDLLTFKMILQTKA